MARAKGTKKLKDGPEFNGAIGESIFDLAKGLSLQAKLYKKNYVRSGWMTRAPVLLVSCLQRKSGVPKIRTRLEKNHQLEP